MCRLKRIEEEHPIKIEQYLGTEVVFIVVRINKLSCICYDRDIWDGACHLLLM